ncbi:esterase/lipase family protein [Rhodococcus sp. NPDC019627]|jgi:triacylglycerol esterase/lipase EstA (alpha/beta hydrolase family)|uniref:esterase/lipase family protein n=1 Tax=Rhodococcus TaxID=1827 RepID=UPI001320315E|nr:MULTISPECIES: alpha/beta fold hydrolase [Rhodococcus]MDV7355732.1 alpha/beta fold hydrolase [Rhodococcus oxybenzonivorans]QHE71703.1 Lipase LipV [Rhodococcus sp. WAY2]
MRISSATQALMLVLAGILMLGAAPAAADPAATEPEPVADPAVLPGANDWNCKPSPEHPRPVVLVHGTWVSMAATWKDLAPALAAEGYCVFALNYGQVAGLTEGNLLRMFGGADIAESAQQLAVFVDRVRSTTGAPQVDIVGHSLGGTLSRQYLRFEGGADRNNPALNKVHSLVTLGATNHGTSFGDVQMLGAVAQALGVPVTTLAGVAVGPSYIQQMVGSPFLQVLNAAGDTDPGIEYTVVASRRDTVSTPPENTFLTAGPGATVHNVWLQDGCESNAAEHNELTTDPRALYIIQRALDPTYADRNPAPCEVG